MTAGPIGGDQVAPPAHETGSAPTWRGDLGVHNEAIIQAAISAGENIRNEKGEYVGLTYARIIELLGELKVFREGDGVRLLGDTLTARSDELLSMQQAVENLRTWMADNTKVRDLDKMTPIEVISAARALMDTAKVAVTACWPVLTTMWGNVVHTLTQAGVLDFDSLSDRRGLRG